MLLVYGNGAFAAAAESPFGVGTLPTSVAIGDLNGDGRLDLVTANQSSDDVSVLLGDGDGTFTEATASPFGVDTSPQSIAIGDLDSDRLPHLVTTNDANPDTVSVLLNQDPPSKAADSSGDSRLERNTGRKAPAGSGVSDRRVAQPADSIATVRCPLPPR